MIKHNPKTLEELKNARKPFKNVNIQYNERLTGMERLALWMTDNIGTMGFFIIIFIWTIVWLSWNFFAPLAWRFDPYPAFVLWLFISNMFQLLLLPLLMVGQNLQSKHSEARAEADFEVNTRAEQEIEAILQHLENQNDLILEVINKLDKNNK